MTEHTPSPASGEAGATEAIGPIEVDPRGLPRLGLAPGSGSAGRPGEAGLDRHPSMGELAQRTLMWVPGLFEAQSQFAARLRESKLLPAREREIAILRHAWDCGSDYQWGMHAEMALDVGLTAEEVERVATAPRDPAWAPHELVIIRAVDELHSAAVIGDQTWAALAEHYDEAQLVEFLVMVGSYRLLAYLFNSVGIQPPGGKSPQIPGNRFRFA